MYVVFAVLRLYVSALFPDFQPKHRPSAGRQRNLTEAQCVGFEPTRRINARRFSKPLQYHYGNTAEFSCIVKNIRKETADTFLAGVMSAGGFEPPFCYHAYSGI